MDVGIDELAHTRKLRASRGDSGVMDSIYLEQWSRERACRRASRSHPTRVFYCNLSVNIHRVSNTYTKRLSDLGIDDEYNMNGIESVSNQIFHV